MIRLRRWLRRLLIGPSCKLTPGCDGNMLDQGFGGEVCTRCEKWVTP